MVLKSFCKSNAEKIIFAKIFAIEKNFSSKEQKLFATTRKTTKKLLSYFSARHYLTKTRSTGEFLR